MLIRNRRLKAKDAKGAEERQNLLESLETSSMSKQQIRQQLFEEFDYKEKAGTAWSHNYLNQKPWHPLSYPNQRRRWIAEQMHGLQDKRTSEIEKEVLSDFFQLSSSFDRFSSACY